MYCDFEAKTVEKFTEDNENLSRRKERRPTNLLRLSIKRMLFQDFFHFERVCAVACFACYSLGHEGLNEGNFSSAYR